MKKHRLRSLIICFSLIITFGYGQGNRDKTFEESIERGKEIYKRQCSSCHKKDGTGKRNRIPPLAQSDFLLGNRSASIRGIKYGQKGKITVNGIEYDKVMKPQKLNDSEIAYVMNYILNSWGNKADSLVTPEIVANALLF